MRHTFEMPDGWSAEEGRFDDLGEEVLHLTSPGWRLRPGRRAAGDASSPSIFVTRGDGPAEAPDEALPGMMARLRTLPGFRFMSSGRSALPQGRVVTYAFRMPRFPLGRGGETFENVQRAHLFVSGGRPFKVLADASADGWADGSLLGLAESIERNVARENA